MCNFRIWDVCASCYEQFMHPWSGTLGANEGLYRGVIVAGRDMVGKNCFRICGEVPNRSGGMDSAS